MHFPISLKYVDFETRYPPEWFHDPDAAAPAMEDSIKHVSGLADSDLSKSRRKRHMLAADVSDNDNQKLPDNETHGARESFHWRIQLLYSNVSPVSNWA